jgi:hypothetical protein
MSDLLASSQNYLRDATSRYRFATVPGTSVRLLTQTSKMPGPSWSLPAHRACPRANGSICESCYAAKGCYRYSSTRNAQNVRFAWTGESMRTPAGRTEWIARMVTAILESGCECWLEVCRMLPQVRFWIPTRAWQAPKSTLPVFDPLLNVLRQLAQLPNVTVRPSALNFGDYAPVVEGLHAGSTAAMPDMLRARQCPAYAQGGCCSDCRACWKDKETPIS